ncbi:MAG: DUF494 domain-containing protein, partial [Gammaproteobacteria bacterium]|nr:DUF494 domain-containing protein [Gammaproteobacteria bacterium]
MRQNVLDVLLYLFENYAEPEQEPKANRVVLRGELQEAGFHHRTIDRALQWMDDLDVAEELPLDPSEQSPALRIFNRREQNCLSTEALGFIMSLEQSGILTPTRREALFDRLLALRLADVGIEQIKWVVLMVLNSFGDCEQVSAIDSLNEYSQLFELPIEQLMFEDESI